MVALAKDHGFQGKGILNMIRRSLLPNRQNCSYDAVAANPHKGEDILRTRPYLRQKPVAGHRTAAMQSYLYILFREIEHSSGLGPCSWLQCHAGSLRKGTVLEAQAPPLRGIGWLPLSRHYLQGQARAQPIQQAIPVATERMTPGSVATKCCSTLRVRKYRTLTVRAKVFSALVLHYRTDRRIFSFSGIMFIE
jgi:hypothetical protein